MAVKKNESSWTTLILFILVLIFVIGKTFQDSIQHCHESFNNTLIVVSIL